jgi:hypothetical protein
MNTFGKGVSFIRAPFIVIFPRFIALLCALALQTAAADAGSDQGSVASAATVTPDGSGSSDADMFKLEI